MTARLDGYELGPVLAKGGMGAVHEAVERASGRRVAIKRILPHVLDRDTVGRFILEGRAVARLDHPGIVKVHAAGEADGAPFLVMELVEGESLARRLERDGPLPPGAACKLAAEVADALAHAHARGVLHRDLKPANILVDAAGAPRLIDFGLAKLAAGAGSLDHLTRTGELIGTPAFMAPEQANGGAVDARTDVYGLGATLFALLTGRPPFEGLSAIGVLEAVLTRPAAPPSACGAKVGAALDRLVLDCLEKEPGARPASMAELAARLDACELAPRSTGRGVLAAAGALALLALITAGLALSRQGEGTIAHVGSAAPVSPVASPADASRAPPASRRTRGWPEKALAHWRDHDLELRLALPPDGAPATDVLDRARSLRKAGRLDQARALLARLEPDAADRDQVLLRFQVAFELDPSGAVDTAPLDRAIAQDPGWAQGLLVREVQRLRTAIDVEGLARAFARLRELRREDLRTCLEAERRLLSIPTGAELLALLTDLEQAPPTDTVLLTRADLCLEHVALLGDDRERLLAQVASELEVVVGRQPLLARALDLRWRLRMARREVTSGVEGLLERAALATRPDEVARYIIMAAQFRAADGRADQVLDWIPELTDDGLTEHARGVLLRDAGRRQEARAVFQGILDDALVAPPALYLSCASELGDEYRGAWTERYLHQLRRDHPSRAQPWHEAAQLLLGVGQPAAALQASERGLELDPARPGRLQRALILQRLGRHAEAVAELDELVRAEPRDRWAVAAKALARFDAGEKDALADAERAASMPAAPGLEPRTSLEVRLFQEEFGRLVQLRFGRFSVWQAEVNALFRAQQLGSRPLPSP